MSRFFDGTGIYTLVYIPFYREGRMYNLCAASAKGLTTEALRFLLCEYDKLGADTDFQIADRAAIIAELSRRGESLAA